jgi:hypothetical protein
MKFVALTENMFENSFLRTLRRTANKISLLDRDIRAKGSGWLELQIEGECIGKLTKYVDWELD